MESWHTLVSLRKLTPLNFISTSFIPFSSPPAFNATGMWWMSFPRHKGWIWIVYLFEATEEEQISWKNSIPPGRSSPKKPTHTKRLSRAKTSAALLLSRKHLCPLWPTRPELESPWPPLLILPWCHQEKDLIYCGDADRNQKEGRLGHLWGF